MEFVGQVRDSILGQVAAGRGCTDHATPTLINNRNSWMDVSGSMMSGELYLISRSKYRPVYLWQGQCRAGTDGLTCGGAYLLTFILVTLHYITVSVSRGQANVKFISYTWFLFSLWNSTCTNTCILVYFILTICTTHSVFYS